jgi:hypothetical protein
MRNPLIILKSGPERYMGWFSAPPYCPSNVRCNSESMVGTMNRFEKVTLDLFKAVRKSESLRKLANNDHIN